MPPRHRNSATCHKFLHTWAISDITAWETAPDVLRHESVKWQGYLEQQERNQADALRA